MQWNDVCFCILLIDIFGTVGYLLFCLLRKVMDRVSARVRLVFVKMIILLYMVPVIYPIMLISRVRYIQGSWVHVGEFGFQVSGVLELVFRLIATVWVSGLLIGASVSLYHYSRLDRILRWNVPLSTEGWKRAVEKYQQKYGLSHVRVCQNESVKTTLVTGLFRPMIIVPMRDYSEKQMSMMMEHEVWHLRRRDLMWKKLALLVSWFHWFNPFVYRLREYLTLLQEMVCDTAVCDINPEYTPKEYCQFLYDAEVKDVGRVFAATLVETGLSLESRITEMSRRRKLIGMSGRWIFACVMLFVMAAAVPTLAMAQSVVYLDESLRASSEIQIMEETQEPETYLRGLDDGSVEEVQGAHSDERMVQIDMEVPAGARQLFSETELSAGDMMMITVACGDNEMTFRAGVKNVETGELIYMEGSGGLMLNFTPEADGIYGAYIENREEIPVVYEGLIMNP